MRIAIIGGGIGGLATAIALDRLGMRATVYEQAAQLRNVGAALSLWPNATRVLDRLAVLGALEPHAGVISTVRLRTSDGTPLLETRTDAYPTPALCAHRADLQRVLLQALPEDAVEVGRSFSRYDEGSEGVRIHFEDGHTVEADLLIGADGLHSRVRAALLGDEPPTYQGYTIWRGVGEHPIGFTPGAASESSEQGRRFGFMDAGQGRIYWYATAQRPEAEHHDPELRKRDVRRLFGDWHEPIPTVIDATPRSAILRNDAYDRRPRRPWQRGSVVLLGDAAHPMTPNLGQGGCMALEDADVLAQCLARSSSLPNALIGYERARHARTARITRMSNRIGRIAAWTGAAAAIRDMLTRATPARIVERSLDDIYGYALPVNHAG